MASDSGSGAAQVFDTELPPEWQPISPMALFKSGIFVRAEGAVERIARDLDLETAVVYAVWDDPATTIWRGDEPIRTGVTAAFLIRSTLSAGPPWIPLQASVQSSQAELETGILSPWLDQVACSRVRPQFVLRKGRLTLATDPAMSPVADHSALDETLTWLAENPNDQSTGARVARSMLVDAGHGLQRFGVSLMHADEEVRRAAIHRVLVPLAPEVGALMAALWEMWSDSSALLAARAPTEATLELANVLARNLTDAAPLQRPDALALVVSWLAGLFGVRSERGGRQPARALFATARAIRSVGRQTVALAHPDTPLPAFPLDRADTDALVRDLGRLPREETDLERLLRALAGSESAVHIARPRIEHLRPFRIAYPWLAGYPNASRSFIGRFDHVFTGWSFRGAELRAHDLDPNSFRGVFITDAVSITSARAFGRTVATASRAGAAVADGLTQCQHPALAAIGALHALDDAEVVARYEEGVGHAGVTWLRLQTTVATCEYLIARLEQVDDIAAFTPHPPALPGSNGAGIRGHFMYWRLFCRSIAWKRAPIYRAFIDEVLPLLPSLPPKLDSEVHTLIRQWALQSDENRLAAAAWSGELVDAVDRFLAAEDRTWLDGEWLDSLMAALAVVDSEAFTDALQRLMADPRFDISHLDRLLLAPRAAGFRREFVQSPVFRAAHELLVDSEGVRATWGRVEWLRAALERARGYESLRLFLDPRGYPRTTGSLDFNRFFADRGLSAIADPDGAAIELLEIAARHVGTEHLDLVLRALDSKTLWPPDQHLAALREGGRAEAAVARLWFHPAAAAADHRAVIEALLPADSGRGLRAVAVAIARFVEVHGDGEHAESLRAALRDCYQRYRPQRYALEGFALALDGWRIAALGSAEPLQRLAASAAKWGAETGAGALIAFATAACAASASEVVRRATIDALRDGDCAVVVAALDEAAQVDRAVAAVAGPALGEQVGAARLRSAATCASASAAFDSAVAAAVLATLDGGLDVGTLAERLESVGKLKPAAPTAVDDTSDPEPPAEAAPPSGGDAALIARRRERIADHLTSAARRWAAITRRIGEPVPAARPLFARAGRFASAPFALRRELFASLGGCRADGRAVDDPRRLLNTHFLDGFEVEIDALDLAAIVEALIRVSELHGPPPKIAVERWSVTIALPRQEETARVEAAERRENVESEPAGEGSTDGSADTTDDAGADSAEDVSTDDGSPEIVEADDETTMEADDGDEREAVGDEDDAPHEPRRDVFALLRDGYAPEASVEDRIAAFGDAATPILIRYLVKRNEGLSLTVGRVKRSPVFTLGLRRG